jgi:hypothetical protein
MLMNADATRGLLAGQHLNPSCGWLGEQIMSYRVVQQAGIAEQGWQEVNEGT